MRILDAAEVKKVQNSGPCGAILGWNNGSFFHYSGIPHNFTFVSLSRLTCLVLWWTCLLLIITRFRIWDVQKPIQSQYPFLNCCLAWPGLVFWFQYNCGYCCDTIVKYSVVCTGTYNLHLFLDYVCETVRESVCGSCKARPGVCPVSNPQFIQVRALSFVLSIITMSLQSMLLLCSTEGWHSTPESDVCVRVLCLELHFTIPSHTSISNLQFFWSFWILDINMWEWLCHLFLDKSIIW